MMFELSNKSAVISSVDLVKMINSFRKEECELKAKQQAVNGEIIVIKHTEVTHSNFLKSVDSEIETMNLLGLEPEVNFYLGSYADKQGQQRRCYNMTRDGALQMLNKESTYVRVKTVQYVDALENEIILQRTPSYMIEDSIERAERWIEEQKEVRLMLEEKNKTITEQENQINDLQDNVNHQHDIIVTLTEDVDLMSLRQRIVQIVKFGANGRYSDRWNKLYQHFEQKFHCNLKIRIQRDAKQGKCSSKISKIAYICEIMEQGQDLFDIAVVVFKADYLELLKSEISIIEPEEE